jgi:hypothetical protein
MQKFIWSIIKCHGMMIGVGCAWTGLILFGKRNSRNIFISHLMAHQLLCVRVLNVDAWFGKHDVRFTDMFSIIAVMKVSSRKGNIQVMKAAHLILKDQ